MVNGLEIQGLTKRLGDKTVLDDVSFAIQEGEFFAMLGPSGGGKTTLLRLICGLEAPDAGRIVIAGRDVTNLPSRERNLAMVFQEYGLYPNMDVYQNIAYGLESRGMAKAEVQERVTAAAQVLGLADLIRSPITDLSGGEQQRVALARGMAKDADAYLYDEPLSNLDPKLRAHARKQIMLVHTRKRRASLYVTHEQSEALAMGSRIGIMAEGRVQQIGAAEELLRRPANLFVARFMGSPPMNLVPARIERDGGAVRLTAPGLSLPLDGWEAALARHGGDGVVAGIPPDAVAAPGDGAHDGRLAGTIAAVEPMIGESEVTLTLEGGASVAAIIADEAGLDLAPGGPLDVTVDTDRLCLFDPDTERALAP